MEGSLPNPGQGASFLTSPSSLFLSGVSFYLILPPRRRGPSFLLPVLVHHGIGIFPTLGADGQNCANITFPRSSFVIGKNRPKFPQHTNTTQPHTEPPINTIRIIVCFHYKIQLNRNSTKCSEAMMDTKISDGRRTMCDKSNGTEGFVAVTSAINCN